MVWFFRPRHFKILCLSFASTCRCTQSNLCTWRKAIKIRVSVLETKGLWLGVHFGQNLKLNQAESCFSVRMEAWAGSPSMPTGEGRVVELPEFILGAAQVSLSTHLPRDWPTLEVLSQSRSVWTPGLRLCSNFWMWISWTVGKQAAYLSWLQYLCFLPLDFFQQWILQPFNSSVQ